MAVPILLAGCSEPAADYEVLSKERVTCPDGAKVEYQRWGKTGMMAICKLDHGPFIAAEGGKIVLKGEHRFGKPSSEWTWLDATGKPQRTERFSAGK